MENEQLPFGYSHSHGSKRTHTEMESDGSLSPLWGSVNHLPLNRSRTRSPSHPSISHLHMSPPLLSQSSSTVPRRYPGDGMDYRRPVSLSRSSNNTPVIDLTADETSDNPRHPALESNSNRASRPPRFPREIIDVEAEPDQPEPNSPEIQFVSSRTVHPPQRTPQVEAENDEELEILGVNAIPEERRRADFGDFRGFIARDLHGMEHLRRAIIARAERIGPIIHPHRDPRRPGARAAGGARPRGHRTHIEFEVPVNMDFAMVGFNMGLGGGEAPPPPPTYEAPESPPEGFTRSPAEDDILICPNCGDELCTGNTDVKKQVWILKACGHVYCGECATNRHASSRKKGKEKAVPGRSKPFKVCAVEECDKKTISTKSMIQVFL